MPLYIQLLIVTSLGQLIHLLFKIKSLKEKARVGNASFSFRSFFYEDWVNIAITFAFMAVLMYLIEDAVKLYPQIENYLKGIFAVVGYSGSDLAFRAFSRTSERINKVIDEKTNIADGIK